MMYNATANLSLPLNFPRTLIAGMPMTAGGISIVTHGKPQMLS